MAIMKIAPIGVFCLIARTFATVGFSAFAPMLKYMGNVTLALAIQCLVVYQILLFVFTRLNPFKFIKKFLPVMGFAFSTATSNATIPMSIDTLSKKMGVSKQISSFTIPLGATINMDGTSIMQGVAVVFIAQAYGIPPFFLGDLQHIRGIVDADHIVPLSCQKFCHTSGTAAKLRDQSVFYSIFF